MKRRNALRSAAFCGLLLTKTRFVFANQTEDAMNAQAERYVLDFRQGSDYRTGCDIHELISNFRPEPSAMHAFRKALKTESAPVRKNVIQLLQAIGLACDPVQPDKIQIIRDHLIIECLVIEGFMKDDMASGKAAQVLLAHCRPADLAAFNDVFLTSLQAGSGDYLRIAAKAKTTDARRAVEQLAKLPDFQESVERSHSVRIAMAALGNTGIEDEFLNVTLDAERNAPPAPKNRFSDSRDMKDGAAVAEALAVLGQIGTQRCLLTVCKFLRSPMKTYFGDYYERSLRYDAVDAIRFNYPDERILYHPEKLSEWTAVEQFCRAHLSAVFDGSTPELPRDRAYPIPGRR